MRSSEQKIFPESEYQDDNITIFDQDVGHNPHIKSPTLRRLHTERIVQHNQGMIELNRCELDDVQFLEWVEEIELWVPEKIQMLLLRANHLISPWDILLQRLDLTELSVLDMRDNQLGSDELENVVIESVFLQKKGNLSKLKKLFLDNNQLSLGHIMGLRTLRLPALIELSLSGNRLELEALEIIFEDSAVNDFLLIEQLSLSYCALSDKCMTFLSRVRFLNLVSLDLTGNYFSSFGIEALSNISLPNLEVLVLDSCGLADESIVHLRNLDLPRLRSLYLSNNRCLSEQGRESLATWYLPALYHLSLDGHGNQILARINRYSLVASWLRWAGDYIGWGYANAVHAFMNKPLPSRAMNVRVDLTEEYETASDDNLDESEEFSPTIARKVSV